MVLIPSVGGVVVVDLPIQFERPGWLLLLLLIIPCFLMARRSIAGSSRAKATVTFALRVIVILLLATALAQPIWEKRGEGLTVGVILDRSQSIPLPLKASSVTFLQKAIAAKENREDRVAVVTIARDANIQAMPDNYSTVGGGGDEGDLTATNLAAGVRMYLAIAPDDTANRMVLVSDGNETIDSVLAAAEIAKANNIPIDTILLEYEHKNEVIFERIIAPARARQGQSINLKLVLRTQSDTAGTIHLRMNDHPIDLDPAAEGEGMYVELKAGPAQVFPVTLSLDKPGPHQFHATFEPANVNDDEIERNNSAVAVTFVG
ncbi:MAG: VWA domain-containing protein, partial [Phycisphaerales bacterium]|nr:VWA domain-containing protein [Phycisphaerales bacterium]